MQVEKAIDLRGLDCLPSSATHLFLLHTLYLWEGHKYGPPFHTSYPDIPRDNISIMAAVPVPSYLDLAAQKRAAQLALIPPEWRLSPIPSVDSVPDALAYLRRVLSPAELALTEETNITILLRKLSSGELSSLELTTAFAKRAALAHQLTTCCTEIFFEDAFANAKELDDCLAKTGKTAGPLHGLPVSIKDLFSVKGVDTSIGTTFIPIFTESVSNSHE